MLSKLYTYMVSKQLKKVFLLTTFWLALLNLLNIATRLFIFDRTSYEPLFGIRTILSPIFTPWVNFDGQNYLRIVSVGYDVQTTVFFPLFPLIITLLSIFSVINPLLIGLLFSNVMTLWCVVMLYKLVKIENSDAVAFKSVLILLMFPTSFFLIAYYTESLFLYLSLLTFIFLREKRIYLATCVVLLATATRIFGLALIVPLAYEGYKLHKDGGRFPIFILLSPLGIVVYSLYTYIKFGSAFLMFSGQESERFSRDLGLLSPINVFVDAVTKILSGAKSNYDSHFVYPIIVLEFVAIIFAFIMLAVTYKKISFTYWSYCVSFIVIIIFSGGLSSDLRYLLMLFPFYIFLAKKLSTDFLVVWLASTGSLMLFLATLFLRNYWVG